MKSSFWFLLLICCSRDLAQIISGHNRQLENRVDLILQIIDQYTMHSWNTAALPTTPSRQFRMYAADFGLGQHLAVALWNSPLIRNETFICECHQYYSYVMLCVHSTKADQHYSLRKGRSALSSPPMSGGRSPAIKPQAEGRISRVLIRRTSTSSSRNTSALALLLSAVTARLCSDRKKYKEIGPMTFDFWYSGTA